MTDLKRLTLSRHPLLRAIYDVIQAIERCGASPELTAAVTLAGELSEPAAMILDERDKFINLLTGYVKIVADLAPHFDKPLTDENIALWLNLNNAGRTCREAIDAARVKETK